jgi:hypothetical protein
MYSVMDPTRTGFVSGYMAAVPPEWQALLGGPAVTGQCCIPIVSRTSWGPAAFAWNPADLGNTTPVPATPLLYYTSDHETLGGWQGSDSTYGGTTAMGGLALVAGTRTALFVGRNGIGPFCYGNGTGNLALVGTLATDGEVYCYDPSSSDKSQHAYPYNYQIWAYDLNDFAAVKAGQKQPWEIVPYGVWPLTFPTSEASVRIGGVAYDAARQLLYVTQMMADQDGYAFRPLIHVLHIAVPGPTGGGTPIGVPAQLTTPISGSTLTASTAQFQWTAGTSVSQYQLSIGAATGGTELYNQDEGSSLSATVSALPTDGSTVHVRLASLINGIWQSRDSAYRAATTSTTTTPAKAQMTTPAPSSTLTSPTVTLQWTGGNRVSQYWLTLGTTGVGANNLYTWNQGTNLNATVTGLPANGSTVYVRLWSLIGSDWLFNDYTYTATSTTSGQTNVPAQMTTPAPGSTLAATTVQFQWNGGSGVTQYYLTIGTTGVGANNVYTRTQGTNLNATVTGLPANGSTVYVRLWSLIGSNWLFNDYTYAATGSSNTTLAQLTTPVPGSTLAATTVQFQWTGGSGVSQYWLTLGTTGVGGNNIYTQDQGTRLSASVMGLPANGSTVYVRLWSMINGTWQCRDYTYAAR